MLKLRIFIVSDLPLSIARTMHTLANASPVFAMYTLPLRPNERRVKSNCVLFSYQTSFFSHSKCNFGDDVNCLVCCSLQQMGSCECSSSDVFFSPIQIQLRFLFISDFLFLHSKCNIRVCSFVLSFGGSWLSRGVFLAFVVSARLRVLRERERDREIESRDGSGE